MVPARLTGVADLGAWDVHGMDPDAGGARVAVRGTGMAVQLFDLAHSEEPLRMEQPKWISSLGSFEDLLFSPDGRYLAAKAEKLVVVWATADGKLLWQQDVSADKLTFLADSASLWALHGSELLRLSAVDGRTLDRKPLPGKYRILRLAWGRRYLAALTEEQGKPTDELIVFPLPQMEPPIRCTFDKRVGSVLDISADGATVLVATAGPESRLPVGGKVEYWPDGLRREIETAEMGV